MRRLAIAADMFHGKQHFCGSALFLGHVGGRLGLMAASAQHANLSRPMRRRPFEDPHVPGRFRRHRCRADAGANIPRISWVHPPGGFAGLSFLNGVLRILTLGVYHFWGKTEVRQRIWSAVRIDGEPLEYRGTGGELLRGFLIVFFLILLPMGLASFASSLFLPATAQGDLQPGLLGPAVPAVRHRHPPRAPLSPVAHALARHPRRTVGALAGLRLDLPVDGAAGAFDARLDPAVARGAPAEGAVR